MIALIVFAILMLLTVWSNSTKKPCNGKDADDHSLC